MNIALAIVTLFPGGGLQRDCMAVASRLVARGHHVTVFAEACRGSLPPDLKIELLPNRAWTNQGRDLKFAGQVARTCAGRFDRLVGFGKLKALDIVYCADPSIAARKSALFSRLTNRRRILLELERASFGPTSKTRCLLLSEPQLRSYREAWSTDPGRLTLVPPTIEPTRRQPELRNDATRDAARAELGLGGDQWTWLAIAGQPRVKGLDRAVAALREFSDARLLIAGIAPGSKPARIVERWARRPRTIDRISFLGMRNDITRLMAAADLLVHPARHDTTGTVILEGVINGLPVIATACCGYAAHVAAADAGVVVPEPFQAGDFLAALRSARSATRRQAWSSNGASYGAKADLYSGLDYVADIIVADSSRSQP